MRQGKHRLIRLLINGRQIQPFNPYSTSTSHYRVPILVKLRIINMRMGIYQSHNYSSLLSGTLSDVANTYFDL